MKTEFVDVNETRKNVRVEISPDVVSAEIDRIAREPMHILAPGLERWILFWPGHLKWDYAYSIGVNRPDVVTALWLRTEDAMPFLRGRYRRWQRGDMVFYLLEGSTHVDWAAAARTGALEAVR